MSMSFGRAAVAALVLAIGAPVIAQAYSEG